MSTDAGSGKPSTKLSSKEKQRLRAERAAAALREKQRRERRRQVLTVLAVLVAIVALVGGGFALNSLRDDSEETAASIPTEASEFGLTVGDPSAPHKIVVYEDFLCPICGQFEQAANERLVGLAEQGRVQIEYRPFVLLDRFGPYSEQATGIFGLVLQQDGPEVAKAYHDLLFAEQPSEAGPFPSAEELIALAGRAGADVDELSASFESGDGDAWAEAATSAALEAGVEGTPTVLLDGRLFTDYRTPQDLAANLAEAVQ
jgi:protein-disulfide isomerase